MQSNGAEGADLMKGIASGPDFVYPSTSQPSSPKRLKSVHVSDTGDVICSPFSLVLVSDYVIEFYLKYRYQGKGDRSPDFAK